MQRSRAGLALMKSKWPERWSERRSDATAMNFGAGLNITIHLTEPPDWRRPAEPVAIMGTSYPPVAGLLEQLPKSDDKPSVAEQAEIATAIKHSA